MPDRKLPYHDVRWAMDRAVPPGSHGRRDGGPPPECGELEHACIHNIHIRYRKQKPDHACKYVPSRTFHDEDPIQGQIRGAGQAHVYHRKGAYQTLR